MKDEDRQRLLLELRTMSSRVRLGGSCQPYCDLAADELERLVEENARLVKENGQLKTELDDS